MADMSRRRPSGSIQAEVGNASRKRKYDEIKEERESDTGESSTDFPCHYCPAVFVTQISLSRHVLTFHDAEGNGDVDGDEDEEDGMLKQEYVEDNEEPVDQEYDAEDGEGVKYEEIDGENGYYDNEDEYYYGVEENENEPVDMSEYLDTSAQPSQYEDTSIVDELVMMGSGTPSSRNTSASVPQQKNSTPKVKLSAEDLATVLAEVEQLTADTTNEFVTCPLCRKTFGRRELPIHISCEHGGTKFTCPYCNREISRRDHLKRHIKNVHPDQCTETEIGPFPRNLNLSRATISNANNTPQKKSSTVQIHEANRQMTPVKALPISIMTPRTILSQEEDDEEDAFEGEDDGVLQNSNSFVNTDDDDQNDSMQITVEPDLPFQDLNDYEEEDYNTPSFLLDSFDHLNAKIANDALHGNLLTLDNMAFQCSLCNAVFTSKVLLDRHEATHSELRPHKCSICNKGFLRKEHLSKHLSSVHSGMKFTCEFCGKDISRKDHLIRHIRNVHPNQFYSLPQEATNEYTSQQIQAVQLKAVQSLQPKPKKPFFNCDMCEATFVNVDDLHAHQATVHSDVRKYKCNYCCKAFKRKEHLTKHEVLHTGERNHTCLICGSEFQRKDALQEHVKRTHGLDHRTITPAPPLMPKAIPTLPCNLCDQMFQDRGMLLSHMTTVHGLIVNSPPGLPKNIQQQRLPIPAQTKQSTSHRNNGALKPNLPIAGTNLGSLMDLINKGSITLSFHPIE